MRPETALRWLRLAKNGELSRSGLESPTDTSEGGIQSTPSVWLPEELSPLPSGERMTHRMRGGTAGSGSADGNG